MAFARFARDSGVTQEIQTIVDFDRDFWVDDNSLANRVNAIDPYIYFGFSIDVSSDLVMRSKLKVHVLHIYGILDSTPL